MRVQVVLDKAYPLAGEVRDEGTVLLTGTVPSNYPLDKIVNALIRRKAKLVAAPKKKESPTDGTEHV